MVSTEEIAEWLNTEHQCVFDEFGVLLDKKEVDGEWGFGKTDGKYVHDFLLSFEALNSLLDEYYPDEKEGVQKKWHQSYTQEQTLGHVEELLYTINKYAEAITTTSKLVGLDQKTLESALETLGYTKQEHDYQLVQTIEGLSSAIYKNAHEVCDFLGTGKHMPQI